MSENISVKMSANSNMEKFYNQHDMTNLVEFKGNLVCSDGNHTFEELYDHRITLFITLCHVCYQHNIRKVWRSKLHSDGSEFKDWFIMGITASNEKQITYHLPMDRWEETWFADTLDRAPEWDGHTPADVIERLKNL